MKLQYWNDIEYNFMLESMFSKKIAIGNVELCGLHLNSTRDVWINFDLIDILPDKPPEDYGKFGVDYDRCTMGIGCVSLIKFAFFGNFADRRLCASVEKDELYKVIFWNKFVRIDIDCREVTIVNPNLYLNGLNK